MHGINIFNKYRNNILAFFKDEYFLSLYAMIYIFLYSIFMSIIFIYSFILSNNIQVFHSINVYNNLNEHLHLYIMLIIIYIILIPLSSIFYFLLKESSYIYNKNYISFQNLELWWTITPGLILSIIAYPSILCLYELDMVMNTVTTLKILGNQWYWNYQLRKVDVEISSYNEQMNDLKMGDQRLKEVTNSIYLPSKTNIKLLVSSNDVIHSFSLPSLGIKVDALPGRVNQVLINISNAFSMLKGNCTEICGIYHNSMSTSITIINKSLFKYLAIGDDATSNKDGVSSDNEPSTKEDVSTLMDKYIKDQQVCRELEKWWKDNYGSLYNFDKIYDKYIIGKKKINDKSLF